MIEVNKKQDCCGCTACAAICPKDAIIMKEDNEGFLYPTVDKETVLIVVPVKGFARSFILQRRNLLNKLHISYRIKIKKS